MKLELLTAILHTGGVTADAIRAEFGDITEEETQVYLKILAAMDGQKAIVSPSSNPGNTITWGHLTPLRGKKSPI